LWALDSSSSQPPIACIVSMIGHRKSSDLELAMEQLWGRRENNVPLDGPEFTG
jgi:hypothetical protein